MLSLKFFVASIVLAGFFLSVQSDELILIRPPKDEDCHRFDEMYLQGTKLMNDFSASNCHRKRSPYINMSWPDKFLQNLVYSADSALNYFKRLHALRNKVKELGKFQKLFLLDQWSLIRIFHTGCRQSAVNLYAFNDEVLKFFRGNCWFCYFIGNIGIKLYNYWLLKFSIINFFAN